MPDISGSTKGDTTWSNLGSVGTIGAIEVFHASGDSGWSTGTGMPKDGGNFRFRASWSNSIYGSSNTVTPLSKSTLYILKY